MLQDKRPGDLDYQQALSVGGHCAKGLLHYVLHPTTDKTNMEERMSSTKRRLTDYWEKNAPNDLKTAVACPRSKASMSI